MPESDFPPGSFLSLKIFFLLGNMRKCFHSTLALYMISGSHQLDITYHIYAVLLYARGLCQMSSGDDNNAHKDNNPQFKVQHTIQVHNMLDGWPLQTLDLHSNILTFGSFWTDIWLPYLTKGRPYPAPQKLQNPWGGVGQILIQFIQIQYGNYKKGIQLGSKSS